MPTLQKTQLGWIVGGEFQSNLSYQCNLTTNLNLQEQICKFWEIEESVSSKPLLSKEEKLCEEIFSQTTTRNEEGRFVVHIPFKKSPECLGDSKQNAIKRFHSLESKLNKNSVFKSKYVEFISEYHSFSHMTECPKPDESKVAYYFPHHGVLNEKSQTTKLRVVFDGSAQSDTGVSLNDIQCVGPVIQDDLLSIILRFRQYKVVIGADMVKMYHLKS
ncbi:uncharacterized protein LOC126742463 [Anthonomus grandis grandis]|uniref:uncharacterized protein LOC126742463 n=1 Tax=Anthonomus grandis grandis TaxID=2921223 RepID=UPI0021656D9C|nr:uncharacterized protein LOC126742463 [Anthonomus grandis grandis]